MPYSKLLLNAGGGIISTKQQAQQAKNTASVLIGLGGTGIDCLRTLKTQVYSRLLPDDPEAIIPEYKHIRFLGVDTDEASTGKKKADTANRDSVDARMDLDEVTEFFSIINPGVGEAVKNKRAMEARPEMSWYNHETPPPKVGAAGAGAIRQIGRFMLMDKADGFMNAVTNAINAAKTDLINPTVNIHIFSGISGGTGSGTFLDVCYMIREITRGQNVKIFGYFFLPDVNLSRIDLDEGKISRDMIMRNGYAAMQELDYCMNLPENGGSFVQTYKGGRQIAWNGRPVDMCHLISSADEAGNVISDPYNYAMNVTAEYVMDFLTAPIDDQFDLSSHQANFVGQVAMADGQKILGVNLAYCVIGAASASLPLREINTYLASELFAKFSTISSSVPTERDVEALAVGALGRGISNYSQLYESLLEEMRDKADPFNWAYYDQDFKFVLEGGDKDFTDHYSNQRADKFGIVERNAKSMKDEKNMASLLGRIRTFLDKVMRDVERGPIFAYRMMEASETHNLVNFIDGLIETNDLRLSQAESARSSTRANYEGARADFLNRSKRGMLDSDKKRFLDYENATRNEVDSQLTVDIYKQLGDVLVQLRKQVIEITNGYYVKLKRVMENLIETFKLNRADLEAGVTTQTDTFSIPMLTIEEIKDTLDEQIEHLNIPNMMSAFMGLLVDHETEWLQEDENKIARLVTKFFVETAFANYANRSINEFLKDKYKEQLGTNPDDVNMLANLIYRDWIQMLTQKASPLFVKDPHIRAVEGSSGQSYISMPETCAAISLAAQRMHDANSQWEEKGSALTDRIFVMCSRYVLPICSYKNQKEYGDVYFGTRSDGVHLYEGGEVPGLAFNNWKEMAPIMPYYYLEGQLDSEKDAVKRIVTSGRELFDKALSLGVIDMDSHILAPNLDELRRLTAEAQAAPATIATPQDAAGKKPLLDQLNAALELKMERLGNWTMQADGQDEPEVRSRVVKDHFIASPSFQLKVSEIIAEMDAAVAAGKAAASALAEKIEGAISGVQTMGDYCDALFTGAITISGATVSYIKAGLLGKKVEKLCEYGPAYPYAAIPVYQGYVSYKALDEATRKGLSQTAAERINSGAEEIKEAATNLKTAVLSERQIAGYVNAAATMVDQSEVISFLEQLVQRFESFCLIHNIQ